MTRQCCWLDELYISSVILYSIVKECISHRKHDSAEFFTRTYYWWSIGMVKARIVWIRNIRWNYNISIYVTLSLPDKSMVRLEMQEYDNFKNGRRLTMSLEEYIKLSLNKPYKLLPVEVESKWEVINKK